MHVPLQSQDFLGQEKNLFLNSMSMYMCLMQRRYCIDFSFDLCGEMRRRGE